MIEQGVYQLLTADPGTSALVGNGIYWILQPKGTTVPSIVLSIVSTGDLYTMAGCTGLRNALLQVSSYASDYYTSRAVSRAVRLLLESYTGTLPDTDQTQVIASFIEKDWDMPFEPGAKGFIYRSLLEVRSHYYDAALTDGFLLEDGDGDLMLENSTDGILQEV